MWVTTIWGSLTTAANAQHQKKSYSYYKPLAHEIYVKFVLSLYCFHSVNKLGGRARKSGILVCFLLLQTTPKPKAPWRGKVYSVLQVSQEPRDRNWRTGPGGHFLLARLQAHIQLPFGTIQGIFWGWSCPQCADPPTSVSKKKNAHRPACLRRFFSWGSLFRCVQVTTKISITTRHH